MGSDHSGTITRDEYLAVLARRVLYSRTYTGFYISVICAAVFEVRARQRERWPGEGAVPSGAMYAQVSLILLPHGGIGQLPQGPLFTAVETYVTLGLLSEVAMRLALQRRRFCSKARSPSSLPNPLPSLHSNAPPPHLSAGTTPAPAPPRRHATA